MRHPALLDRGQAALAVIDMQEELRSQALKLVSGSPNTATGAPGPAPRPQKDDAEKPKRQPQSKARMAK